MTRLLFLIVVVALLKQIQSQALTTQQQTDIVNSHNKYRKMVNPPAKSMPDLVWDPALARIAETYIVKCQSSGGSLIDHNAGRSTNYSTYVGENMFLSLFI
jgi:uncharacterized protein YkwD